MTSKQTFLKVGLAALFMLLSSAIGLAGPPMEMKKTTKQPAVQTPVIQEKKIQQPIKKIYSISIDDISLTSRCQLKFILKNTGADLTDEEFTNCSVKIGQDQNPPTPFNTIDPGKRLTTHGGTITYVQDEPLTTDTNITIEVTLFNGTKKSKQKSLHPTCTQAKTISSQVMTGTPVAETPTPKTLSGKEGMAKQETPGMGNLLQPETLIKTHLEVKRLGGGLETWDDSGATDTSMQRMNFRWETSEDQVNVARWEASQAPNFSTIIAHKMISPIPAKNSFGYFSIDFNQFSGAYPKPATFYIRVRPVKSNVTTVTASGSGSGPGIETIECIPSSSVKITITQAGTGEQTQFNLPKTHLKVVFETIDLIDDSDEMSGGDLGFMFTVHGTGRWQTYGDDKWEDGAVIPLSNMAFIVSDPPEMVGISVQGCDNDMDDGPGEEFTAPGFPGRCGEYPDMVSGNINIVTQTQLGAFKIPPTPFSISATGSKLKFHVHGHWELYCDPCP